MSVVQAAWIAGEGRGSGVRPWPQPLAERRGDLGCVEGGGGVKIRGGEIEDDARGDG